MKTDAGRIKLAFEEPQFFVNPTKKTVTCKIVSYIKFPNEVYLNIGRVYGIDYTIIATETAVCRDGDVFDETLGRHIAESKAKKTAYQTAKNRVLEIMRPLYFATKSLTNFVTDMMRLSDYEIEHLSDLSDKSISEK